MSRTAAAELARLKVRFAAWTIRRVGRGEGFTAQQEGAGKPARPLRIHALTLADLDDKLAAHEGRRQTTSARPVASVPYEKAPKKSAPVT
jgi:hypothetical protein